MGGEGGGEWERGAGAAGVENYRCGSAISAATLFFALIMEVDSGPVEGGGSAGSGR